jgi:RNA polymerase sigma factor (sigma-70 family)
MEDVSRDPQLEQLTSELSWLKRLATALVRDENDANDVVHETWLVAAEHAPTDGRPLKPWLSRVALNVVRMRSRASTRRRAREIAVESFAEQSPTPDELLSRVEDQRIVVDQVLKLAEPYRKTVLLHYFQDLSSAEIARRTGIPEGTVRRRLKVALDELRGRLHAEERKTGRAVLAGLAPLAVKHSAASGAVLGVVVVKKAIALVVVVVGLLLVGSQLYIHYTHPDQPVVASDRQLGSDAARSHTSLRDSAAAHIVVAVTDDSGPIANAVVRCAPVDGEVVVVETASDGDVSIDLAAGPWSIAASADGHEPKGTNLSVVASHDDRVRLVLVKGGRSLTGIVTDVTGGAIAGARIDAARLDLDTKVGGAVAVGFSDRTGHYKLAVGGGEILVAASHPDYASQTRYVELGASGATADFALLPGGVIEGVVRDLQTNQPVAGAAVRAHHDSSVLELAEASERIVKADAAGKFRFAGLRPGAYELFAREGARNSHAPVGVGVGVAEQHTDIVVLIGATGTMRGKVVDDSGAPAPNVTVRARGGGRTTADGAKTISNDAGAFVLEGLGPTRWALRGTGERYISDGQAIVTLETSDVNDIVVHVRRGLEVRGHVEPRETCTVEIAKDESDNPLAHRDSITTNVDGEFRFGPFGPGNATLTARCPNGDEGTSVTTVPDGQTVVPVAPGGSIQGRIVDTSGKPVVGVMVAAESSDDPTRVENGSVVSGVKAFTSTGGTFEIRGLAAATYRLSARNSGLPMKAKKSVNVALAAAQHATGVELVVERADGTIQGIVTGPDGTPIADAWVALDQTIFDKFDSLNATDDNASDRGPVQTRSDGTGGTGGSDLPPALTDARGHFELTNLSHGRYQVVAEARSGKLRGRAADVTTDTSITIRLASVSSLHGTVHGSRGPTALFSVRLAPEDATEAVDIRSFTDGAFVFSRLDPGDYTIDVTSSDGTAKATAHVLSNETASVDVLLVANGTVTGRLVDKAGKPLSGMAVALIPEQPPGQLQIEINEQPATSGADGRFQVEGPPGVRTLAVLGPAPTLKRGLSVTASTTIDVGDVVVVEQASGPRPFPAPP